MSDQERILDDIRRRAKARRNSDVPGGVREWFDIEFLLRYIDGMESVQDGRDPVAEEERSIVRRMHLEFDKKFGRKI